MKALIAMSGGVDSSVAALLTKEAGYDCVGCTMKLYQNEDAGIPREHSCCSLDDVEDARSVAVRLGMPYYVFNMTEDFHEKVIQKFVDSYEAGRTPNPCIDCNRYMKFDKLFDKAKVLGCDYVVTGHYVRIQKVGDRYQLLKAIDPTKDQSYVLYTMTQDQLAHTMFPLGEMCKTETRDVAEANGFINAKKPDSQDICFVPDGDYAKVIELHTGHKPIPGQFVSTENKIIGQHKGLIHYTIGQHRWLGLGHLPGPLYVCGLRKADNAVIIGHEADLFSTDTDIDDVNWISGVTPTEPLRCAAKVRYRQQEQDCVITPNDDGTFHVHFTEPQRAITPGQAAVFYDGEVVLGGGTII